MRRARKTGQGGFTLIEVMISMVVFMIALLGLVALQRASIAGTNKGREHTAAVNIAKFVMAQLENEAASWTLSESVAPSGDLPMVALAMTNPSRWTVLADGSGTVPDGFRMDAYFQHSDRSFYTGENVDTAPFCVHYMVSPIGPNQELLQVRVRVTWPKWKQYVIESEDDPGVWNECTWPGYDDPDGLEDRLKYSEIVELTGIVTREYTSQMVQ
jgi:prepilin-type N-terminal cleavage/methylation domain-containing protein